MEASGQPHAPAALPRGMNPGTSSAPGAGLDGLHERKISEPSRDSNSRIVQPAAQSLYPLRYHGPGLGCHINPKIPKSILEEIKNRLK